MRSLLLASVCLLSSCSPGSARELIAPYEVGSVLPGGHRVATVERTGAGAIVVQLEGEPAASVLFFKREDGVPAFTRTAHCNVVYDTNLPSGSRTPQALGQAVQALASAASSGDEVCLGLGTSATVHETAARLEQDPPFPWAAAALAVLAFALLGMAAGRLSTRLSGTWKERIFWAAVLLITAAGASLRLPDLSMPFCESAYTQRVELAESSFWQILTYEVIDGRHPPMTALLMHLTLPLGRSEWVIRLPFVIASSLSLPLVALLGKRIEGRLAGAAACLACAVLQPLVFMGHQASAHSLLFALAPCVLLSLHWMLDRPGLKPCLALAAANAAVLWTNYLAGVLVGPQLVLLAWKAPRTWMGRALGLSAALTALPLYRMVMAIGQDVSHRAISERAPEIGWGDATVGKIFTDGIGLAGIPVSVACAVLGLAGAILLVRRGHGPAGRGFAVVFSAAAWLGPLAILALTPVTRMKGWYMFDLVPLLVLLAVIGAVLAARLWAGSFSSRWPLLAEASTWGAAFIMAVLAAWPAYRDGPRALAHEGQHCSYGDAARIIARSDVHDVIIPFGHSRTLFGYYLGGHGQPVEDRTGLESWRYGDTMVRTLVTQRDLPASWRRDAERNLEAMASREPLWLVDVMRVEHSWPELEQAGRCREHTVYDELRLLMCPGLSAPAEPHGP